MYILKKSLSIVCALTVQGSCCDVYAAPAISPPKKSALTLSQAIATYGESARSRIKSQFLAADIAYPPKTMTWIALKEERLLLIFAQDRTGKMRKLLTYPIIGASGVGGPKLKEGDKQVPEGFYKLVEFRPNVIAHLGLAINYPNDEDRAHARNEKRTNLGFDILIHGSRWSTGCLAMGNEPIEDLFVLAYDAGLKNIRLILAPCNLAARKEIIDFSNEPHWLPKLYERLAQELRDYPI